MEQMYWIIENYTSKGTKLMEEGQRLYSEKLTIKQVEQATGFKLRVAGAKENPEIIVCAYVDVDGRKYIDNRKQRGSRSKCYMITI